MKRVEIGFNRGIIEIDRGSSGGRGREEFAERNESASMYVYAANLFCELVKKTEGIFVAHYCARRILEGGGNTGGGWGMAAAVTQQRQ